jgi:hypothetical protein
LSDSLSSSYFANGVLIAEDLLQYIIEKRAIYQRDCVSTLKWPNEIIKAVLARPTTYHGQDLTCLDRHRCRDKGQPFANHHQICPLRTSTSRETELRIQSAVRQGIQIEMFLRIMLLLKIQHVLDPS